MAAPAAWAEEAGTGKKRCCTSTTRGGRLEGGGRSIHRMTGGTIVKLESVNRKLVGVKNLFGW